MDLENPDFENFMFRFCLMYKTLLDYISGITNTKHE